MLGTYGALALLLLASVVVGARLATLAGLPRSWAAGPAYGLALLTIAGGTASVLPGEATTAAVLVALLVLASLPAVVRPRPAPGRAGWWLAAMTVGSVVVASIPFIGRERVGLLGVSLNNDTSAHLVWIERLHSAAVEPLYSLPAGYPLAPHGLVAVLATVTGVGSDAALDALLLAVPALTVLTAYALVEHLGLLRGALAAGLAGFSYLAVAYFGQGAFKETMLALFLLAFAAGLRTWEPGDGPRWGGALVAVPAIAGLGTYSYQALAWFAGTAALFVVARWVALLLDRKGVVRATRAALTGVPAALMAGVLLALPALPRVVDFSKQVGVSAAASGAVPVDAVGNLMPGHPLSGYEALGIWLSQDFRLPPADAFRTGQLAALALAVVVYGVLWSVSRRRFALPSAVLAAAAAYVVSKRTGQSPYVNAKALAIMAPSASLVAAGALLALPRGRSARVLSLVAIAAFGFFAVKSSLLALRYAPVSSTAQRDQLDELRGPLQGRKVLFMGNDDYAAYELRGVRVGYYSLSAYPPVEPVTVRPAKGYAEGGPLDWDSFPAAELDRFDFAVTVRSGFDSEAPPNWRLVRSTGLFELWRRAGRTPERSTIEGAGSPGGVLDCRGDRRARRLSRRPGQARVLTTPVVAPGPTLGPGVAAGVTLPVPRGRWTLSLQYTGREDLTVQAAGRSFELPANLGRPGPYFYVGEVRHRGGPLHVSFRAHQANRLASSADVTVLNAIAATQPQSARLVPLAQACGRWVDWYRAAGPNPA